MFSDMRAICGIINIEKRALVKHHQKDKEEEVTSKLMMIVWRYYGLKTIRRW